LSYLPNVEQLPASVGRGDTAISLPESANENSASGFGPQQETAHEFKHILVDAF